MIRSFYWFILALSLMFNAFFVLGSWQAHGETANGDRVTNLVAAELNLDESQSALFAELRRNMEVDQREYEEGLALVHEELISELSRDEPNLQGVHDLVDQEAELRQQRGRARSDRFNDFVRTLSPEQCRKLSRRVGHSRRGRAHWQAMLQKFDKDGDGQLNDEERAAAQEHIKERRKDHEQRRREMHERFDANGDGQIDDAERAAMREWMSQRNDRKSSDE
ncbi:MAG: periplasmic heavy metal sensor [Planctomycetes bacterium]|nr:periplasmic heavy metal sensor [Planctomycetota bacterium]